MKQEIETKFDVPLGLSEQIILNKLRSIAVKQRFNVGDLEIEVRQFQYYDTPNLDLYKKGETIRRVSGFDLAKNKGRFRYDFKIGNLNNRYEENYWTNLELSIQDILSRFNLKMHKFLVISAIADTKHYKIILSKDKTIIEATLDLFNVRNGAYFKELEIELKEGNYNFLTEISNKLKSALDLQAVSRQKYSRVIDSLSI